MTQDRSRHNRKPTIDHRKLLGFRNVVPVANDQGSVAESCDLALVKRGIEGGSAAA